MEPAATVQRQTYCKFYVTLICARTVCLRDRDLGGLELCMRGCVVWGAARRAAARRVAVWGGGVVARRRASR